MPNIDRQIRTTSTAEKAADLVGGLSGVGTNVE
jgi:hypothetical protein